MQSSNCKIAKSRMHGELETIAHDLHIQPRGLLSTVCSEFHH